MKHFLISAILFLSVFAGVPTFAQDGFTQKDRELLIELKVKMEEIDNRFEQIDKRFEQIDKRFVELREDMNNRFEDMFNFFYILSGIFTALVVVVIGFAYWDRRTMIREARREAIEFMEKEGTLRRLMDALKDLAKDDHKMAEAFRKYNLL